MTDLERTISDAEAVDKIVEMYRTWGQMEIFENTSSTIESIGDILEQTGRQTWFEEPGYLTDDPAPTQGAELLGEGLLAPSPQPPDDLHARIEALCITHRGHFGGASIPISAVRAVLDPELPRD